MAAACNGCDTLLYRLPEHLAEPPYQRGIGVPNSPDAFRAPEGLFQKACPLKQEQQSDRRTNRPIKAGLLMDKPIDLKEALLVCWLTLTASFVARPARGLPT